MSILFLISHIPNPRINKRIGAVKELADTTLICWDKQAHQLFELEYQDVPSTIIKLPASSTEPLKRIKPTIIFGMKALGKLRRLKPGCIYAGNLDMLLIAYLYSVTHRVRLVYEVADLNRLIMDPQSDRIRRILQKLIKMVEKTMCRKIDLLVLTSVEYYNFYYKDLIPQSKLLVIPNVPDLSAFKDYRRKSQGGFTIGFIGAIRYIEQMKMMIDAVEAAGLKLLIAGAGSSMEDEDQIRDYCHNKDFIEMTGRYNYSEEIAALYGRCDCIYSVYNADMRNVQVAVPNRFYEAIFCELPIIVAQGTYLSRKTGELGVGIAVDHKDKEDLTAVLKRLSKDAEYYNGFVLNCRKAKKEMDITTYNDDLKRRILQIQG